MPIPLCLLLVHIARRGHPGAAGVHRVVAHHVPSGAELEADGRCGGAVTLIRRFMSAANLKVQLHCQVPDREYQCGDAGVPSLEEVDEPTCHGLDTLLHRHDRAGTRRA